MGYYDNYTKSEEYLEHHGILGQKWGVRRFQEADGTLTEEGKSRYKSYKHDYKDVKKISRQLSASKKAMKERAKMQEGDYKNFKNAEKELEKVNNKFYAPWKQKQRREDLQNATNKVNSAAEIWEKTKGEYNRAERIYDKNVKDLIAVTNRMKKEYGDTTVKEIKTKDVKMGEDLIKTVVKTGITLADIPGIGTSYSRKYINKASAEDRRVSVDAKINSTAPSYDDKNK